MAGGSGTRLRPLTCDSPKPMVSILNRPIAEHIIHLLRQNDITEIIATLHYLPDALRDYFQDGSEFGVKMIYAVEEDQPLGTAGCVKNIEELLRETFLVISGDSVTDFDLRQAIEFHRSRASKATIVLARVPNPLEFGVVITNEAGQIQRFLEKPSTSEVFSDTVNTGIYILEPEVLDYLPTEQSSDFSQDLFPMLLDKQVPIYGYVADGYWCDVGNLETYRAAQYDTLANHRPIAAGYTERSPGIWIGAETVIDPSAKIESPALIGSQCRIGPRVVIEGGTIIGDHVTIGADADLKRPIIWNGCIVGDEAHLRGCVVARGVQVDRRAHVLEGAVVGPLCSIGEEARISPYVRVWPNKNIEAGAILNSNLIWGYTAHRNLFGQRGVAGLANVEIIPEFAVKLGAAFGSTLKPGAQVTVSRDQRPVSRMVSRSIMSGLMSVGIHIQDLESTAIPVARSVVPVLDVAGGIHIRVDPRRSNRILIEFFDEKGINLSKTAEKKIEGAFFKEDFRRAAMAEIGNIVEVNQAIEIYSRGFAKEINAEAVEHSSTKVVIDYAYAVSGAVLPQLLAKFGCDAVVLNASLTQKAPTSQDRETLLNQLGHVVEALRANFGVQVAANGELLVLVDEAGDTIRGETLTALMVDVMLSAHPRSHVVVPVHASSAVETIAYRHDSHVIRTKDNPTALMEACYQHPNTILGGSGEMGFIFPQLHPGFDAMFCIAKLIEMLQLQERSLGEIRANCPRIAHRTYKVRCPWKVKGALMRHMVETHANDRIELIDGVKIFNAQHDSWVLILPDASEPLIHIYANSENRSWVDETLREYKAHVQNFVAQEAGRID
ncbi:mannose-1-phosphate guanyltransferase [Romeriopsis navalis]|nr:mannose-1-phosphate guanyltransferase [Romeriopsis navalis]